jgi:hypothetical protein
MSWFGTFDAIQKTSLTLSERGLWTLSILVFQVFGPLVWWLAGPGVRQPDKAKAHFRLVGLAVLALLLVVFLSGGLGGGSEEVVAPEPVRTG